MDLLGAFFLTLCILLIYRVENLYCSFQDCSFSVIEATLFRSTHCRFFAVSGFPLKAGGNDKREAGGNDKRETSGNDKKETGGNDNVKPAIGSWFFAICWVWLCIPHGVWRRVLLETARPSLSPPPLRGRVRVGGAFLCRSEKHNDACPDVRSKGRSSNTRPCRFFAISGFPLKTGGNDKRKTGGNDKREKPAGMTREKLVGMTT